MIGRTSFFVTSALLMLAAPAGAQPSRDAELHTFLQQQFAGDRANFPDTRYVRGWADLDDDGRPEAFVYLISGNYCGSGGCTLYIYTPDGNSFRQIADISVTQPPVRVLNSRTGGWRHIAVGVSGGGARTATVLLAPQDGAYPDNPTVDPARPLRRVPRGEVMIAEGDRGRPLF